MINKEEWRIWDCLTAFELDFVLLLAMFETDDFSLACFSAVSVTTSNIVGRSLIKVYRRFLQRELHIKPGYKSQL